MDVLTQLSLENQAEIKRLEKERRTLEENNKYLNEHQKNLQKSIEAIKQRTHEKEMEVRILQN